MRIAIALVSSLACAAAFAAPVTKTVSYQYKGTDFESTLVYDDASDAPRPGLVLVPNWMGATDAAVEKAKTIAGDKYVILVADVYGKGVRPKDTTEALAQVKKMYADVPELRRRANEALEQLKAQAGDAPIDTARLGALGFCFGGATVLELARNGADIAGVASFHGSLDTSLPVGPGVVKASILAMNGADDTNVPKEQIAAFEKEFTEAKADWQFVNYSGAVHCFAEPDANSPPGCVYDETAAKRSYRLMDDFFADVFAR